jgi:hypothetical protein
MATNQKITAALDILGNGRRQRGNGNITFLDSPIASSNNRHGKDQTRIPDNRLRAHHQPHNLPPIVQHHLKKRVRGRQKAMEVAAITLHKF